MVLHSGTTTTGRALGPDEAAHMCAQVPAREVSLDDFRIVLGIMNRHDDVRGVDYVRAMLARKDIKFSLDGTTSGGARLVALVFD